jgi:hypothetical protein
MRFLCWDRWGLSLLSYNLLMTSDRARPLAGRRRTRRRLGNSLFLRRLELQEPGSGSTPGSEHDWGNHFEYAPTRFQGSCEISRSSVCHARGGVRGKKPR